jgi:hypothetical protein
LISEYGDGDGSCAEADHIGQYILNHEIHVSAREPENRSNIKSDTKSDLNEAYYGREGLS